MTSRQYNHTDVYGIQVLWVDLSTADDVLSGEDVEQSRAEAAERE